MFSPSNAHLTTDAPRLPVSLKNVPLRKTVCFLHDLPRIAFKDMKGLAVKVLSEPINHKRQRRWASAVNCSGDARKAIEAYTRSTGMGKQPLGSGCARAAIAQKLDAKDAIAVISALQKTGEDSEIIVYLRKKHRIVNAILEGKMSEEDALAIISALEKAKMGKFLNSAIKVILARNMLVEDALEIISALGGAEQHNSDPKQE